MSDEKHEQDGLWMVRDGEDCERCNHRLREDRVTVRVGDGRPVVLEADQARELARALSVSVERVVERRRA